jgi:hypothetical protein
MGKGRGLPLAKFDQPAGMRAQSRHRAIRSSGWRSPILLQNWVRFSPNADSFVLLTREAAMMGEKSGAQGRLFYQFDLDEVVPAD